MSTFDSSIIVDNIALLKISIVLYYLRVEFEKYNLIY